MKMQTFSLPPLRPGIHINTVSPREPPARSWSRYKKLLIDNPKDSNLLQRQKLWNFQKLNRGAFRSQITSLPDIPYRVHVNTVEKCSVGIQTDLSSRIKSGLKVIFANSTNRRVNVFNTDESDSDESTNVRTQDKACSPMHVDDTDEYADDFEDDSSVDDPGFEFDTVVKIKNAGTMTDIKKNEKRNKRKDRKKKSLRDKNFNKEKHSLLMTHDWESGEPRPSSHKKSVKFYFDGTRDVETQTPEVPLEEPAVLDEELAPVISKVKIEEHINPRNRVPTPHDASNRGGNVAAGNVGHSSQMSQDSLSVLDFLSGSKTDRTGNSENRRQRSRKDKNKVHDADADRDWFQKIVGDVDVIDTATYNNFARIRPNVDSLSDSNNDRYNDLGKSNYSRKNVTPRINNEFGQYNSLNLKDKMSKKLETTTNTMNKNRNVKRGVMNPAKFY